MTLPRETCWVSELGLIEYRQALDLQSSLVALRHESKIPDVLCLLEHPHVYTGGRRFNPSHLLLSDEQMLDLGVSLCMADRGGELTYHGPGQLVGYPIIKIAGIQMIKIYLKGLEEVLIRTVAEFGIMAERLPGYPGVWVGFEKLAAIGLRINRGVTKHGFALNVSPNLSYFDGIVPCGLFDKGATSLSSLLGYEVPVEEVRASLVENFGEVFGFKMVPVEKDAVFRLSEIGF